MNWSVGRSVGKIILGKYRFFSLSVRSSFFRPGEKKSEKDERYNLVIQSYYLFILIYCYFLITSRPYGHSVQPNKLLIVEIISYFYLKALLYSIYGDLFFLFLFFCGFAFASVIVMLSCYCCYFLLSTLPLSTFPSFLSRKKKWLFDHHEWESRVLSRRNKGTKVLTKF